MSSPTQRSLALLRAQGYIVQVVERWQHFARVRIDLFNGIDIVAIREHGLGVLGVQTTSRSNLSARRKKLLAEPRMRLWVACGNQLHLHGWKKVKGRWQVVEEALKIGDFPVDNATDKRTV